MHRLKNRLDLYIFYKIKSKRENKIINIISQIINRRTFDMIDKQYIPKMENKKKPEVDS